MTADDLLTRLRGRLTPLHLPMLALDAILDALRPECEAIAREMAELRDDLNMALHNYEAVSDYDAEEHAEWMNNQVADAVAARENAESSRVALRQALQRLCEQSRKWQPKSEYYSWPHDFNAALKAAEALLAHEPTQEPPR